MLIGHFPAGYLLGVWAQKANFARHLTPTAVLLACIAGALTPDIDMLYFYLVDHRQHHHHTYVTHLPVLWCGLLGIGLVWYRLNRQHVAAKLWIIYSCSGLVHLTLDSIVGDIWWLAPLVDQAFSLFEVTDRYDPWWLNFVFHWSFLLEFCLWVAAYFVWKRRVR